MGGKLRVRITSPGYKNECNCRFPRKLRVEGRTFTVPSTDIKLLSNGNAYYYSVSAKRIKINDDTAEKPSKVFTSEDPLCAICFEMDKTHVFAPCGHYYCCIGCASKVERCPICRQLITYRIDSKLIQ